MLTETAILFNLKALRRHIRAGEVPTVAELPDLAADWAMLLADLTDQDLSAAVAAWLRGSCPFWPTPGQLLAAVPRRQLAAVDDSGEAWAATVAWCRANGFREPEPGDIEGESVERDEAIRAALQAIGGAKGFGRSTEAEEPFLARRFADAYKAHRKRGHIGAEVLAIAGPSEAKRLGGAAVGRFLEGFGRS